MWRNRANVNAKAAAPRLLGQLRKAGLIHMDQGGMIATFDVDFRLFIDAFVDDGVERIASANRGNGASGTVPE